MASNLLGAMAGGLVEYFSMMTGFRNLLILAFAFYFVAWLTRNRQQCLFNSDTSAATNSPDEAVGHDLSGIAQS